MPFGLIDWIRSLYGSVFTDREIYIRSQGAVSYITLGAHTQALMAALGLGVVCWAAVFTVLSFMSDTEIAHRDDVIMEVKEAYENRIRKLQDRYVRLEAEIEDSERRFDEAMRQLTGKHGQISSHKGVELALQGRLEARRRRLAEVTEQRDDALTKLEQLRLRSLDMERRLSEQQRLAQQRQENLEDFVSTLNTTSGERDVARRQARDLQQEVARLSSDLENIRRHQSHVMAQLEEAARTSIVELERIVKKTGVDVPGLMKEIERAYRGEGGPFVPLNRVLPEAAEGFPLTDRAVSDVLSDLQRINSLRIALEKLPLMLPITDSFRFSSGFGPRRHPVTGKRSMHYGTDMAAPRGTRVIAPTDGVVKFAGRQRGYGNVVKIRHAFGYETVYAHLHAMHVTKGQRVEAGQKIGEVGSTGRSTGNHLHYEIRRFGKPLNPRKYIEAGRHVF